MFRDIAALLNTPARVKALAYILKRNGQEGSAQELAALSGMGRLIAQKELNALARLSIVRTRGSQKTRVYVPNDTHPLFGPLTDFITTATAPSNAIILQSLKGVRGLWLVVAAGVLTGEERSKVDLLLVCRNPEHQKIARAVKKLENSAAIPIRYAVFEVEEYLERRQAYDRMLRDIFEYRHRIVLEKGRA